MKSYRKQKSEAKRLEKLLLKQQKLENKVPKVRGPRKMMRTFVITGAFYYQRHVVHMVMTALGFKLDTEVRKLTQYLFRATPHDPAHDIATYQNYQPLTERTKVVTTMEGFKNVVQSVLGSTMTLKMLSKQSLGRLNSITSTSSLVSLLKPSHMLPEPTKASRLW